MSWLKPRCAVLVGHAASPVVICCMNLKMKPSTANDGGDDAVRDLVRPATGEAVAASLARSLASAPVLRHSAQRSSGGWLS